MHNYKSRSCHISSGGVSQTGSIVFRSTCVHYSLIPITYDVGIDYLMDGTKVGIELLCSSTR